MNQSIKASALHTRNLVSRPNAPNHPPLSRSLSLSRQHSFGQVGGLVSVAALFARRAACILLEGGGGGGHSVRACHRQSSRPRLLGEPRVWPWKATIIACEVVTTPQAKPSLGVRAGPECV
jgi:hypothetical protein